MLSFENQVRKKIAWRILPFVFVLYIISYLDRANVAFAKLSMTADLGFSEAVYGFGAGIFFLGYLLLEVPGALIVEHWSARRWIARILLTWGMCTVWIGFIHTSKEFYWVRFFLGVAEAGFFPGLIVYLSHWFSPKDRARAMSGFTMAVPISLAIGAPISAAILSIDWMELAGWRWMFILEGLPAILFGIITWFYLTDRPKEAAWLQKDERQWIENELAREMERKRSAGKVRMSKALRDRNVVLMGLTLFFVVFGSYGFLFWLPTTIKNASEMSAVEATRWAALPFVFGFGALLLSGWSSDRTGERKFHVAVPMFFSALFFALSTLPNQRFSLVVLWLCLTGAAAYAWAPAFWALPTLLLGESAAAVSIGLINCIGNLGGFVGPSIVGYLLDRNYSQRQVVGVLATSFVLAGLLACGIKLRETEGPRSGNA